MDLMMCMAIDPSTAHRWFRAATRGSLSWIEAYLDLGIRQIGVGGDFAGTRTLISPEHYRRYIVPEVRQLSRRVHLADGRALKASDGDLRRVIDDFVLACDVDGYLKIDMRAGMDLKCLKERFGSRITLYGNMDCGEVLYTWPVEELRRVKRECLRGGWGRGGHIYCASNAITGSVTVDRYLAMVSEYRRHFDLPELGIPAH